jgi:NAD(P)-dependent dehydrogenase (short-subunit alcohol dehydrogenase family)
MASPEGLKEMKHPSEEIDKCISLLDELVRDPGRFATLPEEQRIALLKATGEISRPGRAEAKKRNKAAKKARSQEVLENDRRVRNTTGIRSARMDATFKEPPRIDNDGRRMRDEGREIDPSGDELRGRKIHTPRNCYVCKEEYADLHFFYDAMCKKCGDLNYRKRFQTAPLHGKVALLTGGRVKIGYQAALMMLRAGATVIATTRFPVDAATRYSREEGYAAWGDRLHIHGLDLRHIPSVELFTRFLEKRHGRLDILINNAAQTVRRPAGFYSHLIENEKTGTSALPREAHKLLQDHDTCRQQLVSLCNTTGDRSFALAAPWHDPGHGIGIRESAQLSQISYGHDDSSVAEELFPKGKLDCDLQQVDLRKTNSWRLRLGEIPAAEMLEVQLVNSVAPFVLCNRLVSLMRRDHTGQKHIVNVTAMEGKFFRFRKDDRHPHTNMAKAALNMMTHTSAEDLARDGIYMNAVDTGWVTDEDPLELSQFKQQVHDFQPPLDIVDGAARVCDPFFDGIATGKHWCGKFLKDYFPIDW